MSRLTAERALISSAREAAQTAYDELSQRALAREDEVAIGQLLESGRFMQASLKSLEHIADRLDRLAR